jgi:hypothetical protein
MKCSQCQTDVPPQWRAALLSNACPCCSAKLMDEQTQELMTALKDAMEQMPNDPIGVAGWLISNYKLTKIGSYDVPEKLNTKPTAAQNQQRPSSIVEKIHANSGLSKNNLEKLKEAKANLNNGGFASVDMDIVDEVDDMMSAGGEDGDPDMAQIMLYQQQINAARSQNPDALNEAAIAATIQKTKIKQMQAQDAVLSGGKPSKNGFTRAG